MAKVQTVQTHQGLGMLILRLVYFFFIGLWLSGIWASIAWFLSVTIIGLPFGLWMLNRMPQVATLQPQTKYVYTSETGEVYTHSTPQHNFFLRAIYFLLIGWWFSALWIGVAWGLSASIIGLPISFWMFNRVPGVLTLAR